MIDSNREEIQIIKEIKKRQNRLLLAASVAYPIALHSALLHRECSKLLIGVS